MPKKSEYNHGVWWWYWTLSKGIYHPHRLRANTTKSEAADIELYEQISGSWEELRDYVKYSENCVAVIDEYVKRKVKYEDFKKYQRSYIESLTDEEKEKLKKKVFLKTVRIGDYKKWNS